MRKRKLILGCISQQVCDFEVPGNLKVELLPCSTERMLKFL